MSTPLESGLLEGSSPMPWLAEGARRLCREGYLHTSPEDLDLDARARVHLGDLQAAYGRLPLDTASRGNRYRAFQPLAWARRDGPIRKAPPKPYYQEYKDNEMDGGRLRRFAEVDAKTLANPVLRHFVEWSARLAALTGRFDPGLSLDVNIHMIRYMPTSDAPAFSSPALPHTDTEEFVALLLVDRTPNLVGGENSIWPLQGLKEGPSAVFQLDQPLEGFVVLPTVMHAVGPMGVSRGTQFARRDILVVTFHPAASSSAEGFGDVVVPALTA